LYWENYILLIFCPHRRASRENCVQVFAICTIYTPTALWPARDSLCLIWKNCSQKKRALFVKWLVETNKFSSCHFAFKFSALITRLWEHGFYQDHFQVQCFSMESMRTKIPQNLKCTTRRDILNHHSSAFIGNLQFLLNHTPG
jgi:hypothetical protein